MTAGAARISSPVPLAIASAASILCLLHCLAAPVLVLAAPALVENPLVELPLTAISVAFAVEVARGAARRHGERRVWIPVVLGTLVLLARWVAGLEAAPERVAMGMGSLFLLSAVGWDARLRRRCACEGCGCARVATSAALADDGTTTR